MILLRPNALPAVKRTSGPYGVTRHARPSISARRVWAKVHRDRWCVQVHDEFPQYGFAGHKGYGTAAHMAALHAHGACVHHRRSFAPVAQSLREEMCR